MFYYLRRRVMLFLTWRLMHLNQLLGEWTKQAREQAVVHRAGLVVEQERAKVLREGLTRSKD